MEQFKSVDALGRAFLVSLLIRSFCETEHLNLGNILHINTSGNENI